MANGDKLCDMSFAGGSITIDGKTLTDFMDDSNPIEFNDTEVATVKFDCNGKMIRTAKSTPIIMSVTIFPGGTDENELSGMWKQYRVRDGSNSGSKWDEAITAILRLPKTMGGNTYKLTGGTMISGPSAPGVMPTGKMKGLTYTFAFTNLD